MSDHPILDAIEGELVEDILLCPDANDIVGLARAVGVIRKHRKDAATATDATDGKNEPEEPEPSLDAVEAELTELLLSRALNGAATAPGLALALRIIRGHLGRTA